MYSRRVIVNEVYLNEQSASIRHLCAHDRRLAKVISMIGPIQYQLHTDCYSFFVNHIIGQMLSNKVRDVLYGRLLELCSGNITAETIAALPDEQIRSIGLSNAKVHYIREFTDALESGQITPALYPQMSDQEIIRSLTAIRGIGVWTAKMYLIFALDRPDVLPYEDGAFLQSYKWLYKTDDATPSAVRKKCRKWHPYASVAARYMYRALDMGITKQEFHLFKQNTCDPSADEKSLDKFLYINTI